MCKIITSDNKIKYQYSEATKRASKNFSRKQIEKGMTKIQSTWVESDKKVSFMEIVKKCGGWSKFVDSIIKKGKV